MLHSKHIVTTSNAHMWTGEELQSKVSPSSVFQLSVDKVPHFLNQEFENVNIFDENKAFDSQETGYNEPIVTNSNFNNQFHNGELYGDRNIGGHEGPQALGLYFEETEADQFINALKS